MASVTASAPGKLMLFGEHAVVYGRPCIVTAVDQQMRVRVGFNGKGAIVVRAPGVGLERYHKRIVDLGKRDVPDTVRFIEVMVRNFREQYGLNRGLDIETASDFSVSLGFGSSAAVTVALVFALAKLHSIKMSRRELFEICYKTILDVQGVGSGFDVAAAIYGGTLYFVGGGKRISSIDESPLSLVVGYSGIKADTPTLVRLVGEYRRHHPEQAERIFSEIEKIVDEARFAIEERRLARLGKLMDCNQTLLSTLGVSSEELDRLIAAALEGGALGAKLSGAGGGDCMIALVDAACRKPVAEAITKAGGQVLPVAVGAKGVANGVS